MQTFHDAGIVAVEAGIDQLVWRLEDVTVERGRGPERTSGRLRVRRVSRVEEDGAPVHCDTVGAGFDGGEVLDVTIDGGALTMIVRWTNVASRRTRTAVYRVVGDDVSWEPDPPFG